MLGKRTLGREFGWLWAAFAVSTLGAWLAFDAFPLIAILVLHAPATEVSLLAAAGLAAGAVIAVMRKSGPIRTTMMSLAICSPSLMPAS